MNRDQIIEAMARAMHATAWGAGQWETSGESEHREMLAMATAALAAIEAAGAVIVPREDLERVREILWERGESEAEHEPLWLVRQMLASPFKETTNG
jgi:hypothetical protein